MKDFAVSDVKLNVSSSVISEIMYNIPSADIFLSIKNWYCVVFKNISIGGNKGRKELKNKCNKITDISNKRRKIVILSANLAFLSVKKVIPNIENKMQWT